MAKVESKDDGFYTPGDESFSPFGIDMERYNQRFFANSSRLFVDGADNVEIIRILSGDRAKGRSQGEAGTLAGYAVETCFTNNSVALQAQIDVSHGSDPILNILDTCKILMQHADEPELVDSRRILESHR